MCKKNSLLGQNNFLIGGGSNGREDVTLPPPSGPNSFL